MEMIGRLYRNGLYTYKSLYGGMDLKSFLCYAVMNPVLQVVFFSLIATEAYGEANIAPYVIGNALILITHSAFFGVGSVFVAERFMGTIKSLVTSPVNKFSIFVSKLVFYILEGLRSIGIGLLTGVLFFGVRLEWQVMGLFLITVVVVAFSACAMALAVGSLGLVTRDLNLIMNLMSMGLLALTGANFPVEWLPLGLRQIGEILPVTHGLKVIHMLLEPETLKMGMVYQQLGLELLIGISYCVIAYIVFRVFERMARVEATLDIY
ncbi:MAG: ABC transporter permease [Cellulosilyticaceae bacterium]